MLSVGILKEDIAYERRVALTAEVVQRLVTSGFSVFVESEAGVRSGEQDDAYKQAGATILKQKSDVYKKSEVIVKIHPPSKDDSSLLQKKQKIISFGQGLSPALQEEWQSKKGVALYALEKIPRITRTQNMDVLSSQANLAGYRAVIEAMSHFEKAIPMMTTAAGSIKPAKAFIMGTGVAGLQAIATAKRMGAIVSATDVRPSTKDQVMSLGATFVAVEDEEFLEAQTAGGYAKEMSSDYQKKQAALILDTIAQQDIVITTALIPGRTAPILIDDKMLHAMKPGSVIVDLAVASGGNCSQAVLGKCITYDGVHILSGHDLTSKVAPTASYLFARNMEKFLQLFIEADSKDPDQEAIRKGAQEILDATLLPAPKTKTAKKSTTATTQKKKTSKKTAPSTS